MSFTTILGAGGPIADELTRILTANNQPVRLVSRNPKQIAGAELVAADIADREQCLRAVEGSSVVYLLVGLRYDLKTWKELWPRIMANTIEACERSQAKLIFFDNVYMYGKVNGPMTEETPYAPCSRKGEIRARIARMLMDKVETGKLTAMIARSADFYGPRTKNGVPNVLVLEAFAKGSKASWLVNDSVPHSYTFTPDAARGLAMLAESDSAWNDVWHLPTAPNPLTGREFIAMAAKEFNIAPKYMVLSRPMLWAYGWFNPVVRESYEMLYQSDSAYVFDSSKFARKFGFTGTPYADGIRIAAGSYKSQA